MELEKCSFEDVRFDEECVFRTDKQMIIHAVKVGDNRILNRSIGREAFTGQYHEVWKVVKDSGKRVPAPGGYRS